MLILLALLWYASFCTTGAGSADSIESGLEVLIGVIFFLAALCLVSDLPNLLFVQSTQVQAGGCFPLKNQFLYQSRSHIGI